MISENADKLICEIVETAYPWVQSTAENDAVLEKVVNKLENYIATLEAENTQLKERLRWKSIEKDGLPDLQRDVLVVMIDDAIAHGYLKFADNKCVYFYFSHDPNASIEIENVILWKYDSLPEVRE